MEPNKSDENPKTRFGLAKPNLFLVPPASTLYEALAFSDGAAKYGPYNWRLKKVIASIYVAACRRHLDQWVDGEDIDPKSGFPHLGHAKACLGILIDAHETGNLVDDRPPPGAMSRLIDAWTKDLAPPPTRIDDALLTKYAVYIPPAEETQ